jgi:hypothetical protein
MPWDQGSYEQSVSSRCWWYTPYDAGWEASRAHGADLRADDELQAIVAMEAELGGVPEWAARVVGGPVNFLPGCGHFTFPRPYLEAVSAIGDERPPSFLHTCYTADRTRKERMLDYIFCLDGWLAEASPEQVAGDLVVRRAGVADWPTVCADLWRLLGERTEVKETLVARVLHRQRWWVKTLIWDDDRRDLFLRGAYLAETRGERDSYGNPPFGDPYFAELAAPRVTRWYQYLARCCPSWDRLRTMTEESWLCAPKAFRFLERTLWAIGQQRPPVEADEPVPAFLDCGDTLPDKQRAARWWREFLTALRGWWRGRPAAAEAAAEVEARLGPPTPVKRWLVRLLVRKLEVHQQYADTKRLVGRWGE